MKKQKEKKTWENCPRANRITAGVLFLLAIILEAMGYKAWILYAFAGIFWINSQFDKTNWLILEIAQAFAKDKKP